jgi:hypothetical protein
MTLMLSAADGPPNNACRLETCLAAATAAQTEVNHASEYANLSTLFGAMATEIRENREQTARLHVLMDELTSCGVLSVAARDDADDAEDDVVDKAHDADSSQPCATCAARSADGVLPVHHIPSGVRVTFAEPLEAADAAAAERERGSSAKCGRARTMGASTGTTDRKGTGTMSKGKGGKVKAGKPVTTTKRLPVGAAAAAAAATLATRPRGASFAEAELAHSRTRRLRLLYKQLAELDASL